MARSDEKVYQTLGFLFLSHRPHFADPGVYTEWLGCGWSKAEIKTELHMGRLPEGLLVMSKAGPLVVVGRQGAYDQVLATMPEALDYRQGGPIPELPEEVEEPIVRHYPKNLSYIRRIRLQMGWTQREVAEFVGVNLMTIVNIERGAIVNVRSLTGEKLNKFYEKYEAWWQCRTQ